MDANRVSNYHELNTFYTIFIIFDCYIKNKSKAGVPALLITQVKRFLNDFYKPFINANYAQNHDKLNLALKPAIILDQFNNNIFSGSFFYLLLKEIELKHLHDRVSHPNPQPNTNQLIVYYNQLMTEFELQYIRNILNDAQIPLEDILSRSLREPYLRNYDLEIQELNECSFKMMQNH